METRSSVPVTPTTNHPSIEQEQDEQSRRCGAATVARLGGDTDSVWCRHVVVSNKFDRGRVLRSLRRERGWTSEQLAYAAKVSPTVIRQIERDNKAPMCRPVGTAILAALRSVSPLTEFQETTYEWVCLDGIPDGCSSSHAAGVAGGPLCPSKAIGRSTAEHARQVADESGSLERIALAMRRVEHAVRELAACVEMELAGAARVGKAAAVGDAAVDPKVLTGRYVAAAVRLGSRPAALDGERADLPVAQETPGDDGHAGLLGGVVAARPFAEAAPTCGCCDPSDAKAGVA